MRYLVAIFLTLLLVAGGAALAQRGQNGGMLIGGFSVSPPPVVNGVCGSSNGVAVSSAPATNLCGAGTASAVTGTGPWTWNCAGAGGGTTASCSAPLSGGNVVCNSPTVPHPAQAAGFTTLAYCADFTTTSGNNNVVNGTAQNTNWATMGWLDCAGNTGGTTHAPNVSGAQWVRSNGGQVGPNPCSAVSFGTDPATSATAMIITATPAQSQGLLAIQTASSCATTGDQCYEVFPAANQYAEINWRYNATSYMGGANFDFFSFFTSNAANPNPCLEIDTIEIFSNSLTGPYYSTGGGIIGYGCGNVTNTGSQSFALDANYNTQSALDTANSAGTVSVCTYRNGVPDQIGSNSLGGTCNYSAGPLSTPKEMAYLDMWNGAGQGTSVTSNVPLYTAWIRVWSCPGWNTTGNPYTQSNTCNTASPYANPP